MTEKSMLLSLREAASVERDELIRHKLRTVADDLSAALKALSKTPTQSNLRDVQGHWSNAVRILGFTTPGGNDGSKGSGLKDGALLAEAA